MRVVRDALAMGASPLIFELIPFCSPLLGASMPITGARVDKDSGSLRVRKRVEDWRYIFEIWEPWREEVELAIDADRTWDGFRELREAAPLVNAMFTTVFKECEEEVKVSRYA